MSFSDKELLHGAALMRLFSNGDSITAHELPDCADAYELRSGNHRAVVLMKYSTSKKSPWHFTFSTQQVAAIKLIGDSAITSVSLGLICHVDGVCCLQMEELPSLGLTLDDLAGCAISVRRPRNGSYWVTGPGRHRMERSIPQNRWSSALVRSLGMSSPTRQAKGETDGNQGRG